MTKVSRRNQGVLCALVAGLLWGLVFIAPLLLPDYPALALSLGRYLAFGLIALPLACLDRKRLAKLSRADWLEALKLALVGNLLYYFFLAAAIQTAGAPLATVWIATLPLVIAVCANYTDRSLAWRKLLPTLLLITGGLILVNQDEFSRLGMANQSRVLYGSCLAIIAVAAWT